MPSPWPLAPALTALGGAVVGFVLASATAAPPPSSLDSAPAPLAAAQNADPNLEALLGEVRALGDRIEGLARGRQGPGSDASTDSERTALATETHASSETADVARLLERCTTLLERLEQRAATGAGPARLAPAPATATRAPLEALDVTDRGLDAQLTEQHRLSGYQQVLDRYGTPDNVWNMANSIQVSWAYNIELRNGDTFDITFVFIDGMVSRVYE